MKKFLSMILATMIAAGSATAYAVEVEPEGAVTMADGDLQVGDSFIEDDLKYTVLDDGTLEVSCPRDKKDTLTEVVIPSEVNGVSVTSIHYSAFYQCRNLVTVEIPDSVTSIGLCAFTDCANLLEIDVAENNHNYCSEDGVLFSKDKTTLIQYPVGNARENYEIPEGVTSIRETIDGGKVIYGSAFAGCKNLKSVTIPKSITKIGDIFSGCTNLATVTISEGVTTIGSGAFRFRASLTSVIIPESVTTIESRAFDGCTGLTSITLPKGVTEIGERAFGECTGLTSITIPEGVTLIKERTFWKCTNLSSVTLSENITSIEKESFYGCASLSSITIPEGVTSIGDYAFDGCTNLTSIILPKGVTEIGRSAFSRCTGLTTITIPDSVTSIGDYAFDGCTGLTSITLPKGVTEIGRSAFSKCTGLTTITIPDSVTSIGNSAFLGCTVLSEINVGNNNPNYCSVDGVLFNKNKTLLIQYPVNNPQKSYEIPNGVETIESSSFWGCIDLTSLTIPKSVTTIGENAFYLCSNLIFAAIPDGVTKIEKCTFKGCTSLKSVIIPDSVETIGDDAFANSGIEKIRLPKNIAQINDSFYNCQALKTIKIPKSVKEIAGSAFGKLNSIDVYYEGSEEDWAKIGWRGYHGDDGGSWGSWNIEDIFNPTYTYGVMLGETIHYNVSYDDPDNPYNPIQFPVEIKKPETGALDTSGMAVAIFGGGVSEVLSIGADGTVEIGDIADGSYTFTFSAKNCAPRAYDVTVSNGSVSGLEDGVELHLYGDIDGDGKVNMKDVGKANAHAKNTAKLSDYDLSVSDINGDGKINMQDVGLMNAHAKNTKSLW